MGAAQGEGYPTGGSRDGAVSHLGLLVWVHSGWSLSHCSCLCCVLICGVVCVCGGGGGGRDNSHKGIMHTHQSG